MTLNDTINIMMGNFTKLHISTKNGDVVIACVGYKKKGCTEQCKDYERCKVIDKPVKVLLT